MEAIMAMMKKLMMTPLGKSPRFILLTGRIVACRVSGRRWKERLGLAGGRKREIHKN